MDFILSAIELPVGLVPLITFILGGCLVAIFYQVAIKNKTKRTKTSLDKQIEDAKKEAENIIKSARLDAAGETLKKKEEFTEEANHIRAELREIELRLTKREDILDRQAEQMQQRENEIKQQLNDIQRRKENLSNQEKQISATLAQQKNQLLKITSMNSDEARELLLKRLEDECEHEMSVVIQRKLDEAKEIVDEKSRAIINTAIQRYAAEQTCEATVSTVEIPNDDMKGRIIGREGRNIRAFEKATGVDVIVDDTPGTITVSGFNPVRREVARLSMERLIQDGRIHPSRIEELVAQTKTDVNHKIFQLGKDAAVETNVRGL